MQAYIKGMGIISPQKTFNTKDFLADIVQHENTRSLACIEPVYKEFLDPVMARRMGRIIKMGIAASHVCLKDAGVDMPDAIITGSALGCLEDTEKFLLAIIENEEQFLTPTSFILSTHNTVGAQIALQLKCMNYNFTYVHKGFSFESAVLDGLMTLSEGNGKNVLVGGHDEMTDKYFRVCDRVGYWKKEPVSTATLKDSISEGSIAGEGAAFFMLSDEAGADDYAVLKGVRQIYKPETGEHVQSGVSALLADNGLSEADVDLVIYGVNGDSRFDGIYDQVREKMFNDKAAAYYKHLCGEYQTSASFALWMAAMMLKTQIVPEQVLIHAGKNKGPLKHILIINGFMHTDYAAYLLSVS